VEATSCAVCGRRTEGPDTDRFCCAECRERGLRQVDRDLEDAITDLLAQRRAGATICPSEAARRVAPDGWRDLMEPVRMAARRLVAAGAVEIVAGGAVVDPSTARGPVRIRRARPHDRGG